MVNRVQTFRSAVAGGRPTGRPPGELFVNFPDLQLGVVNAAGAAVDLLAVRVHSTTTPYVVGDHVLQGGNLYRAITPSAAGAFVAGNWSKVATLADLTGTVAAYLPLAGGTLAGPLVLAADPAAALGAATKQMVDLKAATTYVDAADALKANLASPIFTGDPRAPTPATADSDTSIATTAYVKAQGYATLADPAFTGNPTAPTPSTADSDTSIATTAFVKAQGYATLASPALTGNPTAPTPTAGDADTSIATTAFVAALVGGSTLINVQRIDATQNYVPTSGAGKALVVLQAAGGGGGGIGVQPGPGISGAGGAGECRIGVFPASSVTVTIGAAGNGGGPGNAPGTAAADSSFGALMVSKGGLGGAGSNGATIGVSAGSVSGGGSGGIAIPDNGPPKTAQSATLYSQGGSSWFGSGGLGVTGGNIINGNNGGGRGGGGSGAAHASTITTTAAGGDGAGAMCLVFEFK